MIKNIEYKKLTDISSLPEDICGLIYDYLHNPWEITMNNVMRELLRRPFFKYNYYIENGIYAHNGVNYIMETCGNIIIYLYDTIENNQMPLPSIDRSGSVYL